MEQRVRIGYVQAGEGSAGATPITEVLPGDIELSYEGMGLTLGDHFGGTSLAMNIPLIGVKEHYIRRVPEFVKSHGWEAVAILGAPVQLLNAGILEELKSLLPIPVTTAASSSAIALNAFKAQRVLLMTPWDDTVDSLVRGYLATHGIQASSPLTKPYQYSGESRRLSPEDVLEFTANSFRGIPGLQATYFQAPLNYYPVLERIEEATGAPVVTSNTAPLWYLLSKLGRRYDVRGLGRLLSEWPALPAE